MGVGSEDKSVHIYSVAADGAIEEIKVLQVHRGRLNALQFSPNGEFLGSVCQMRDIVIWNVADNFSVKTKAWGSFHNASITAIAWNANSNNIATAGLDQLIFVWDLKKKTKRIKIDRAHPGGVSALAWVDDNTVASVGQDNA